MLLKYFADAQAGENLLHVVSRRDMELGHPHIYHSGVEKEKGEWKDSMILQNGLLKKMVNETFVLSALRLTGLSVLGMRKAQLWDSRHLILTDYILLPALPAPEHSPTGNIPMLLPHVHDLSVAELPVLCPESV